MIIVNRDPNSPMPCGTGTHPYFVRRRASAITLRATGMWVNHPDGLAKVLEPTNLFQGDQPLPVDALEGLDNFFPCTELVTIWGGDEAVVLHGSAKAGVHVYVPAGEDFICVEAETYAPGCLWSRRKSKGRYCCAWCDVSPAMEYELSHWSALAG